MTRIAIHRLTSGKADNRSKSPQGTQLASALTPLFVFDLSLFLLGASLRAQTAPSLGRGGAGRRGRGLG